MEVRKLFTYNAVFTGLAGLASSTQNIQIQADSDFDLQKLTFTADIAIAAVTESTRIIPLCNVLITDTGGGEQFSDVAVPVNSLFGNGELPFILPRARRIAARSSLSITMNNRTAATTYNIQLSFIGEKIYNYPGVPTPAR